MARQGADLKGVASFHGNLAAVKPAQPGLTKAKILVFNGEADSFITPQQIDDFKREMDAAKIGMGSFPIEGPYTALQTRMQMSWQINSKCPSPTIRRQIRSLGKSCKSSSRRFSNNNRLIGDATPKPISPFSVASLYHVNCKDTQKLEDSECLLSLLLYGCNLKTIYETNLLNTTCTG